MTGLRSVSVWTFLTIFILCGEELIFSDSWMAIGCFSLRSELSLRQLFLGELAGMLVEEEMQKIWILPKRKSISIVD
ncbi:K+-transporting ATPase A subunit [Neobacillus drentensis]|nr:K+-transporting ATPase A subunit [Neobacillus drentensis]